MPRAADPLPEPPGAIKLISLADIRQAADRLRGITVRTPLLPFGEKGLVKPESLQPTGSFKLRGAYNALAQLAESGSRNGVVTHSSGNHAQAVARAARLLGLRAVVVMPENAPRVKVDGVRADGAEIVFVGPANAERVARAHQIADGQGLELVSSANDSRVMAGQGTCGLEIVEQLAEMRLATDEPVTVLAPIGLGGLAAGVAVAVKELRPATKVIGVEPAFAADTRDSLAAGRLRRWSAEQTGRTMADGLRGEAPAAIPFAHLQRYLDGVVTVEEDQIAAAVSRAAAELRLVLEPSGAVTLAAMLFHAEHLPSARHVAIASGGNVDRERFVALLARGYHSPEWSETNRS
ncbi:MAG TPA: threonine/serine dehydratase [Candidatus Limnocylindrales bacterium]|nr:threonine/serine dehydratase [Candidatus Limnocylindrales bacterium]